MKINVKDQYRIINDPKAEVTLVPEMPLIIALDNMIVGEAKSIRGAMAIVVGNEYLDCEDSQDEWNFRLQKARSVAMRSLAYNQDVLVCDSRIKENNGVIPNNFAASAADPDYEVDEAASEDQENPPLKIRIENDKVFLLSLVNIGNITILEREDSFLLRSSNIVPLKQCCSTCGFKIISNEKEIVCPVYNSIKEPEEGMNCICWKMDNVDNDKSTTYIDLIVDSTHEEIIQLIDKYASL